MPDRYSDLPREERELTNEIVIKLNGLDLAVTFEKVREACGNETLLLVPGQKIVDKELLNEVVGRLEANSKSATRTELYKFLENPPRNYKLQGSKPTGNALPRVEKEEKPSHRRLAAVVVAIIVVSMAVGIYYVTKSRPQEAVVTQRSTVTLPIPTVAVPPPTTTASATTTAPPTPTDGLLTRVTKLEERVDELEKTVKKDSNETRRKPVQATPTKPTMVVGRVMSPELAERLWRERQSPKR